MWPIEEQIARHREDARNKLEVAGNILKNALATYEREPTIDNACALDAAHRLVDETTAEAEEWLDD